MTSCECISLDFVPVAVLEADYDTEGVVVKIRSNLSRWNETSSANTNLRQIKWYILSNGYIVAASPFSDLKQSIDFAGASKTSPSVSIGATLKYHNAEMDVRMYLLQNGLNVNPNATLEVMCEIINGNAIKSEYSNKIILNGGTDCCDDEKVYDVLINGDKFCLSSPMGECYAEPILT